MTPHRIQTQKNSSPTAPALALFTCLLLYTSTNLFSPKGLRAMRNEVAGDEGFEGLEEKYPHREQ